MARVALLICLLAVLPAMAHAQDLLTPSKDIRFERHDELSRRWQSLFRLEERSPTRDIRYIVRHGGERAQLLLCSRLLYEGDVWIDRKQDRDEPAAVVAQRWRLRDSSVKSAVLRELRYGDSKGLMPVYLQFMAQNAHAELVNSALVNAFSLDATATAKMLIHLVDPDRAGAAVAAQKSVVRRRCLAFASVHADVAALAVDVGLRFALLKATGLERRLAAGIFRHDGHQARFLGDAVMRLCKERRESRFFDDVDRAALADLLACLRVDQRKELLADLWTLALQGERDLAAPACAALWRLRVTVASEQIAGIEKTVVGTRDVVHRNGLLLLLTSTDAKRVSALAGPQSPWALLAQHHADLNAW